MRALQGQILLFEIRLQLRQPLFWLVTGFFALIGFALASSDALAVVGAVGNVHLNAPVVVVGALTLLSLFGLFAVAAFTAGAALRDFEHGTHELFFSRPITKSDYLLGRFGGSLVVAWLTMGGSVLGLLIGGRMPWLDAARLGPPQVAPYLFGLLVMVLPNFLFAGVVCFSLASKTRSMLATYLGVVGLVVARAISRNLLAEVGNLDLAAWLDPFGAATLEVATRYWTVVERNGALPALAGNLLVNRLLWLTVGSLVLTWAVARFRYARATGHRPKPAARTREAPPLEPSPVAGALATAPSFTRATAWRQFLAQLRLELRTLLTGRPFVVLLALGVVAILGAALSRGRWYGTPVDPVTHLMLDAISTGAVVVLTLLVVVYAGEILWRERSHGVAQICDALPVSNGVLLGAKGAALAVLVVTFLVTGALATLGFQWAGGYTRVEPLLYLQGLALLAYPFLLLAVLSCCCQVLARSKLVGFLLMVAFLLLREALGSLGLAHRLLHFAAPLHLPYSDMNGYGHFVEPVAWIYVAWTFAAGLLAVIAVLFFLRGNESAWRLRFRIARRRFRGPVRGLAAVAALGLVASCGWIVYNTSVLNPYPSSGELERWQATYERKYGQYRDIPRPRITAVELAVDLFPHQRRLEARGVYRLVNDHDAALDTLHLTVPRGVRVTRLDLPPHTLTSHDEEMGYSIYRLDEPLAPGDETTLGFELSIEPRGFVDPDPTQISLDSRLVDNGSLVSHARVFPGLGYREGLELQDPAARRRHGLGPPRGMAPVDEAAARRRRRGDRDAHWIDFEVTVSTAGDQIAVAPGDLVGEWTEGGRRVFHYKAEKPIPHSYMILSADYRVEKDRWRNVAIEVYHHPDHASNVARMIAAVKASLETLGASFSPYPLDHLRIVELPRYAGFAASLPGTIPFSESKGFIARIDDDPEALDTVFYVTAHEMAHQWWGNQVIAADVQGASFVTESLAQYSALMVMERVYGAETMRRFLRYELDRYLEGRSRERREETPLLRVETQPYIHYNKGSLAFYALRDAVGEEALDRVLHRFVEAEAFQGPPFATSVELLSYLRQAVPADRQGLLEDLFETITLFDNRIHRATYRRRADGKFLVRVEGEAHKLRADGRGTETEVAMDAWMDVGVFAAAEGDEGETPLFLEKRHVTSTHPTFELVVDRQPTRAGLDPYHTLIDRNPYDNETQVTAEAADPTPTHGAREISWRPASDGSRPTG